jgi:hypothetical protein
MKNRDLEEGKDKKDKTQNAEQDRLYVSTTLQLANISLTLRKILAQITNSSGSTEGTFNPAREIEGLLALSNTLLEQFEQSIKNNPHPKVDEERIKELSSTLELFSINLIKCFEAFPLHIQNVIKEDFKALLKRVKKNIASL